MPKARFRIDRCEETLQHSCKAWIPLTRVFRSLSSIGGTAKASCGLILDPAQWLGNKQ